VSTEPNTPQGKQQRPPAGDAGEPQAMKHPKGRGGTYVVAKFADPGNPTDAELDAFMDALGIPRDPDDDYQ
jgi:hypothetical protein